MCVYVCVYIYIYIYVCACVRACVCVCAWCVPCLGFGFQAWGRSKLGVSAHVCCSLMLDSIADNPFICTVCRERCPLSDHWFET